MPILAFDVDGTITGARQPIDDSILKVLHTLCDTHRVWLVTGSDEPKCRQQVGSLFDLVEAAFCCAGAEKWSGRELVSAIDWAPPVQLLLDLLQALDDCEYDELTGAHFDVRTGMINLSIPGRRATQAQRDRFNEWDKKTQLRKRIAEEINYKHPQAHATLGGKTGIDITERGRGKHAVLKYADDDVWFWCDEGRSGGNDYSLVQELEQRKGSRVFHTTGWQDTYHQLKEVFNI